MQREWYSVELPKDDAKLFKGYLKETGVQFEPSGVLHLIHFECLMDKTELHAASQWLLKELVCND